MNRYFNSIQKLISTAAFSMALVAMTNSAQATDTTEKMSKMPVEHADVHDMKKPMPMKMDDKSHHHKSIVPIGSLPVSDGAAPNDYQDYGVTLHMKEDPILAKVQLENLETTSDNFGSNQRWDGRFWLGNSYDKLWLRSEGSRTKGKLDEGDIEALWGHAITPFWELMLGARHDLGGPSRDWLALGVQGTAPYEYEIEATLYAGSSGRTAARFKASQDWLFTQKLILSPELDINVYGQSDPERGIGAGISDISASLRLRYEFRREFAPYIGVVWHKSLGNTADYLRADGEATSDTQAVAGLRLWW